MPWLASQAILPPSSSLKAGEPTGALILLGLLSGVGGC